MKKAIKAIAELICFWLFIIVLLFPENIPFARAHQNPAPCSNFVTLEPNEIPFAYSPALCEKQIIGYFDMYAGQRASCSISVCVPSDEPITVRLVDAPTDMTYDPNTWTLTWPTSSDDSGLHYVKLRGNVASMPPIEQYATILFNVKADRRPRFELIVPLVD